MMRDVIVHDESFSTLNRIFDEYPRGNLTVLCPVCGKEATVLLSPQDVAKARRAPGNYCPDGHVKDRFNLGFQLSAKGRAEAHGCDPWFGK